MHEKYAKDGLVILTLTIDEDKDEKVRADYLVKTNKFLAGVKPPFRTYDLQFDRDKPPANLAFEGGMPRVFVFNRDNHYLLKEQGPEKEALEKAIEEALKKK